MQEHYTSHQQNPSHSPSPAHLKDALGNRKKRGVAQYAPSFDLTALNGMNGFAVDGLVAYDYLGYSVSTAGDINGDGKADLLLGAYEADPSGPGAGTVYVIFGQSSGFPARFDLTTLNGVNGFAVDGLVAYGYLGYSVNTAGDINGDGKADLVLGAYNVANSAGAVYVILGQGSGFPARFDLATLNGTNGFAVNGLKGSDQLGHSVSTAGDINGDGNADLLLGAWGTADAGTVYVILGQGSGFPAQFNLTTLNGTNGFAVDGLAANDKLGISVSTAGDINGDGNADIVLGAYATRPAGTAYVILGQGGGFPARFDLATLNGTNGFVVDGLVVSASDWLGYSVSTAGDINGDGKTDLVLGAPTGGLSYPGKAYVIFGQGSGFPARFNLTTLNGTNGFAVDGLVAGDKLGYSVSTAGDINEDGKADLVLGAYEADPGARTNAGAVYVILGQSSGFPARFDLTTLNGTNGFAVNGLVANNWLGYSVSTAGDINGDGKADLVLGAYVADPGGRTNAGTVYVILGQSPTLTTPTPTPTPTVPTSTPTPIFVPMPATPTPTPTSTPVSVNRPPQVDHAVMDQTAEVNQTFSFQMASDTFSDPDGDALTYTAAQSGSSVLPSWLQFNKVNRFFSGTPNQIGATPINLTASDPSGLSASTTFNINVQNALPLSNHDGSPGANGGLIGGIIGGLAAVVGGVFVAVCAYRAYRRGFFGPPSQGTKGNDNRPKDRPTDTDVELDKKEIALV